MYFPLITGVLCLSLFCYALLCAHSGFAIILKMMRKLIALLLLACGCVVAISVLWLAVAWVGLQYVIVIFPDHTHLLLDAIIDSKLAVKGIMFRESMKGYNTY